MAKPSNTYAGNEVLVALGAAIRQKRAEIGLSQENLAADSELDRSYVGGVERGEHNITVMNLKKLTDALGLKPSELFELAGY
jgi:transcriptional regulator with XRE-family HTH domain